MSRFRDQPQPSFDLQNHYDSSGSQAIPLGATTYGPGGGMYNQASTQSSANLSHPYAFSGGGPKARSDQWLEPTGSSSNRSKWIVIGSIVALIALITGGIVAGVVVSKRGSSNRSSSGSGGSGGSGTVPQTDPNDPSTFVKDSRLHKSFYGIAYTPPGSQLPNCGNKLGEVITDIQLMSQLTTRVRLYGADCNQSALVLEAIKRTKVDMKVFLGIYPVPDDNGAAYKRQRDVVQSALQTYGTDHVAGITVGNEFMLNYVTEHSSDKDPNSATANKGAAILIDNIQDTRKMLSDMNLNIPVGNSDAGFYFNTQVLESVDYGLSNVHPWFANVSEQDSAGWTYQFFKDTNVDPANALSNKPKMYIAETGWPTKSSDVAKESNGPGHATMAGLQTFLDTFICQANTNGTGYFFFEYSDEPWKDAQFGGVEGWWGLFNSNRTLKPVTIPDCASP